MVKLTEEMIVARTRVSDMSNVKKLNCWGAELTDVSVLRKLVNVEVLSLSVNCITTLADIQNCKNLQELYIRKNKIPDLNEVCWLRDLTKLKNLWLEENPCCNQTQSDLYRATVIRNLPQLQKLDNVVVQPDEVADAMRRGIELLHPYDADESMPYTSYGPPTPQAPVGPPSFQPSPISTPIAPPPSAMSARRGSQLIEYHSEAERRTSNCQYDQYSCPSRRVSNQVFDPPLMGPTPTHSEGPSSDSISSQGGYMVRAGSVNYAIEDGYVPDYHTGRRMSAQSEHGSVRRSPRMSQASIDESIRRMSIQDHGGSSAYEDERNANSYNGSRANSVQHQDPYREPPRNAYARNGESLKLRKSPSNSSSKASKSPPTPIKEHSDSATSEGTFSKTSEEEEDEAGHPLNFRSLQLEHHHRTKSQLSPTNSNNETNTKKCLNCHNGGTSSPASSSASTTSTGKMSYDDGDPRSIVASHYEQTYEQVDQQIGSARQLLEERRLRSHITPERPYPRRPKNRNSNILSAVLCLIKELDPPSLEVAEMAIRCRMEELDD